MPVQGAFWLHLRLTATSLVELPVTPINLTSLTTTADVFSNKSVIMSGMYRKLAPTVIINITEARNLCIEFVTHLVLAIASGAVELIYNYWVLHFIQGNIHK